MSLHGLMSVTMGVPNVEETAAYYADFGLTPQAGSWFSTLDAGNQLRIVHAPTRRLVEMRVGVDDADDLGRAAARPPPPGPAAGEPRREPVGDRAGDRDARHSRRRGPGAAGTGARQY